MKSTKNRNKTVRCTICAKSVRSDNLKCHMRSHRDILAMSDEAMRDELRARHSTRVHRQERRQVIEEIAQQENIPLEHCIDQMDLPSSSLSGLDVSTLREKLLCSNQHYLEKIELGKQVVSIIDEE